MKKNIDLVIYVFLGSLVIGFLALLFYLTQENYLLLKQSNTAVIETDNIIRQHQLLSGDFKNAVIYYSTLKSDTKKEYEDTYGTGPWQISIDLHKLDKVVNADERKQLDSLSKQIDLQVSWMKSEEASNPLYADRRNQLIKNISNIQTVFDNKIAELERISITNVKEAQSSLVRLHNWIIAIIITSSVIIFVTLLLIYLQFSKVKLQNKRLKEIAWIQSHEVRGQVATLLGLGQLLNIYEPDAIDNAKIIKGILETTHKLDDIVRKINDKTDT